MQTLRTIARIQSDFPSKFGIPRQSNLVPDLEATVVFEPEYRDPQALRGLADFSHIWLIWGFSEAERADWSPTVRPPRLGGNRRLGVFATRAPYRPNALGLSSVRLIAVEQQAGRGWVIRVAGADLLDGTPIYDIKPYLPYTDCHPQASAGFAAEAQAPHLQVRIAPELAALLPEQTWRLLKQVLAQDPRPSYQNDPARVYGMAFQDFELKFRVADGVLTVLELQQNGSI